MRLVHTHIADGVAAGLLCQRASASVYERVRTYVQARCTASHALSSPWVMRGQERASPVAQELDVGVIRRMRQYSGYHKVKQSVLLRLADACSDDDELQHLRRQFHRMDINNDGCLSQDEVLRAMRQVKTGEDGRRVYTDRDIKEARALMLSLARCPVELATSCSCVGGGMKACRSKLNVARPRRAAATL